MNVDDNLKRYWPLIVCAMLGVAAYFQASAISSLVSASIGGEPYVPEASSGNPVDTAEPAETAAPILDRNPFDSTTGTIDAPDEPEERSDEGVSECAKGRVVLIAENEDPEWAFASIDDGSGKAELRRVGDAFGGFVLKSLSWDRVVLEHEGKRCFMSMGSSLPTGTTEQPESEADLASRIQRISDTTFQMDRATMDEILGSRGGFFGQTKVTPHKKGDAVIGLELGAVKGNSMLHHFGLKRGDVLQSMSGTQLTSPERLQAAYERFQDSQLFRLKILRNGAPKQIELRIK